MLSLSAVQGLPEIRPGDDLAGLLDRAVRDQDDGFQAGDVLVVAHKVISKAEGRTRSLSDVQPDARARQLAVALDRDARLVQVILEESREVLRAERGVLICVTHHGFVCANAGVDQSNAPGADTLVLLPTDPDASARSLRARLSERSGQAPAIIITDSFGRAWRNGQCDVAIGCAGLEPLEDWRGRRDTTGRELRATWIAVADELAAAADLARSKDGAQPAVLVRGVERHARRGDGPGAAALVRPEEDNLFR